MSFSVSRIDEIVTELLHDTGVDHAPVPVEDIADSLGIQVVKSPLSNDMSGFLYREKETDRSVICVNAMHPPVRQRFTIAHEIGHFRLHTIEEVHVDRLDTTFMGATIQFRDDRSSAAADQFEIDANKFAAALLMPVQFIEADIKKIAAAIMEKTFGLGDEAMFAHLAAKYGVSQHALAIRLVNLNYLKTHT